MMAHESRDSAKIPIWMGNGKDQFTAEHWIKRLENAKASNGWTDLQTVNFAHSALRDKALMFRDYLESERLNPNDWLSFRTHFLQQFGSTTVDHSKATNLSLTQKADERPNMFGWRVNLMVNEFFSSVPQNTLDLSEPPFSRLPDEILSAVPDAGCQDLILQWVRQVATRLHDSIIKGVSSSLGRVVFLNGINHNIRMVTKLKRTTSLHEAVLAAMEAEKAHTGPSDKTVQVVQEEEGTGVDDQEKDVNFIKRKGARPNNGNPPVMAYRKRVNTECWYCHKKGHIQLNCRLRLGRGAAMVKQPRTVQEIQLDKIAYQLDEDEEEEETSETEEVADVAALSLNHLN
jgi:hypothetical protein